MGTRTALPKSEECAAHFKNISSLSQKKQRFCNLFSVYERTSWMSRTKHSNRFLPCEHGSQKCEFSQKKSPIRVAFLKCTHVIFQNIALGKNVEGPTTDLCVESCALPSLLHCPPPSSIVG